MKARNAALWISVVVVGMLAGLAVTKAQTGANADVVAAITKLENDAVKADLANDKTFYEKVLADDWTGGDSGGVWFTKAEVLKLYADPEHNKTNSEKISELKVRVYGNAAVATYKDTYDAMLKGEHRARGDRHGYFRQDRRRLEAGGEPRVANQVGVSPATDTEIETHLFGLALILMIR